MKTKSFRRSKNVEDQRPSWVKSLVQPLVDRYDAATQRGIDKANLDVKRSIAERESKMPDGKLAYQRRRSREVIEKVMQEIKKERIKTYNRDRSQDVEDERRGIGRDLKRRLSKSLIRNRGQK